MMMTNQKEKKSSQKILQQKYEDKDLEVDLLGEPSGKFDYYVLYPKRTSKPTTLKPCKPDFPSPSPQPRKKKSIALLCN